MNIPTGVTGYVMLGLGAALAASLAVNVATGHMYLEKRDELAKAQQESRQHALDAKSCSDGVLSLQSAADARAARAEGARDAALTLARAAQLRGMGIMAKPPAVPGDDCASARVQVDDWLSGRSK